MNTEQKLNKIIEQGNYMIELLEHIVDNAELVSQLQDRIKKTQQAIRELEYEKWFEKQKTKNNEQISKDKS